MYLRPHRRSKNGVSYDYWTLVESIRTERGPRQRTVGYLGKLPGLDTEERIGWDQIARQLSGKSLARQQELFEPEPPAPDWATIDLRGVRAERIRKFGDVYLALTLWQRLQLGELLADAMPPGKEAVPWNIVACLLAVARFCHPSSELYIAEHWYRSTALEDLLGVSVPAIHDMRLYRGLDQLLPHKDAISKHLLERYADMFGTKVDFLLYDITSTYFEGEAAANPKARRGHSRDKRSDCKQICIGLVVTPEGLPIGYEIFAGNTKDDSTLEEMLTLMQERYGMARRIWVFDRGIVTKKNLKTLRDHQAQYLVGTPKTMLKQFAEELNDDGWQEAVPHVEVKLASHPDFPGECFVLCRSTGRREKEKAMLARQVDALEDALAKLRIRVQEGRLKKRSLIERKIGEHFKANPKAKRLFKVTVSPEEQGVVEDILIERHEELEAWLDKCHGTYILRSNTEHRDPAELWQYYIQLTEVEAAFRISKSDLGLRPVFHQKEDRVEAHVLVCFLALVMWRSLEQWMKAKGLGTCARRLIDDLGEIRSLDVVMPAKDHRELRLRLVAQPDHRLSILLQQLGLTLPNVPKRIVSSENVVQTSI